MTSLATHSAGRGRAGHPRLRAPAPVLVVFATWDLLAILAGHRDVDPTQVTAIAFGALPLEDLLFFVAIPIGAVLTVEAVSAPLRPRDGGVATSP